MESLFRRLPEPSREKSSKSAAPTPILPLQGRDREVERLLEAARQAAAGKPSFVFLDGEAGSGKSRLLSEMARRCRAIGVRAFILSPAEKPLPDALLGALVQSMAKVYFAGKQEPDGLPAGIRPLLHGTPLAQGDPGPVHGGIRTFLSTASRMAPLAILIDDLPQVDVPSLDALYFLALVFRTVGKDGPPPRLTVVLAARPDELSQNEVARELRTHVLGMGGTSVALPMLDAETTARLVHSAMPDRQMDARIAPLIFEKSGGNPLFAVSLLDLMRVDGTLSLEGSIVRLEANRAPELPANLRELVRRKLAALSDKERRLLALGSVSGGALDVDFLTRGLGWGRPETLAIVKGLARGGRLVRQAGSGYELDPPLAREVIYGELVDEARSRFHELRARHLEQSFGSSPEHAMEIATHLDRAGLQTQAATYYLTGGRHFRKRYAWNMTVTCFERYRALSKGESQERAEALVGLCEAMLETGRLPEAASPLDEAIALCKKLDLDVFRGHAISLSARRLFMLGDSRGALVAARLAQEIFEAQGEEAALARVVELRGEILDRAGSVEEAEIALEAALSLYTKVGDKGGRASILLELSTIAGKTYRFDRALAYIEQALDTARDIGDPMREAAVIHRAGITRWMRGERAEGRELCRQAVAMSQKLSNPRGEAEALSDLAYVDGEEGRVSDAIVAATEARDLWRALSDKPGEARCHEVLAGLYAVAGPLEEARAFGSAASLVVDEVGDRRTKAAALASLARVALATGDGDQAQRLATEALGISETLQDYGSSGRALSILGVLLCEKGEAMKARELLERALADLVAARADTVLPRVKASLGRARYLSGDSEGGIAILKESVADADATSSPVARAESMIELGRTLGAGKPEGRTCLSQALEVARLARLEPIAERIQKLLHGPAPRAR